MSLLSQLRKSLGLRQPSLPQRLLVYRADLTAIKWHARFISRWRQPALNWIHQYRRLEIRRQREGWLLAS